MADIGITKTWLVSPTKEIDEMWARVQIQEKISMVNRYKQDIEDLQKGRILDLTARIKMLELEIKKMEAQLLKSHSITVEPT
jgi:uncharacterized small protein (DUF1192 family)